MLSFGKKLLTLPLLISAAMAAHQDAVYDLIWHPKTNDLLTYKLELDIKALPDQLAFTAQVKSKVVKIKPNGDFDVETTTSDAQLKHGTDVTPVPDAGKPTVDTYNRRGQKIASTDDRDPNDETNPGLNTLDTVTDQLTPSAPVNIGSTWTAIVKPNPKFKQEAAKVTYNLTGKEKFGHFRALRITYTYRETDKAIPASAEGYILVDQSDFSLIRFEGTIKGARFSDDPDFPSGDATLSVVRN